MKILTTYVRSLAANNKTRQSSKSNCRPRAATRGKSQAAADSNGETSMRHNDADGHTEKSTRKILRRPSARDLIAVKSLYATLFSIIRLHYGLNFLYSKALGFTTGSKIILKLIRPIFFQSYK